MPCCCLALRCFSWSFSCLLSHGLYYCLVCGAGISVCVESSSSLSSLYVVIAISILLVGFCRADVPTIDLQSQGGPPVILTSFDTFRPSPLVSPTMHDSLIHESSVFMVSQGHLATAGDPSKFSCKWCNDSGANRHITHDITDFTSNYRVVSINLTIAKQSISMPAVGIGVNLVIVWCTVLIIWIVHTSWKSRTS